jgi:hypothetical protein
VGCPGLCAGGWRDTLGNSSRPAGEPGAPLADDEIRKKTTGLLYDTGVDPDQLAETILESNPQSVATVIDAAISGVR